MRAPGGSQLQPYGRITDPKGCGTRQRDFATRHGIERRTSLPRSAEAEPAEAQGHEGDCRGDHSERRSERKHARDGSVVSALRKFPIETRQSRLHMGSDAQTTTNRSKLNCFQTKNREQMA